LHFAFNVDCGAEEEVVDASDADADDVDSGI